MESRIKIPKEYRLIVGTIAGLEKGHAIEMDGKSYQAIAQLIHPICSMHRGLIVKKKDFDFDGKYMRL